MNTKVWMKAQLDCSRFDESDYYNSAAAKDASIRKTTAYRYFQNILNAEQLKIPDEYTDAIYDETELECQYYFREAWHLCAK